MFKALKAWWRGRSTTTVTVGNRRIFLSPEPGAREALRDFWLRNWKWVLQVTGAIIAFVITLYLSG